MLDIGWMEMAVISVIALLILGPKELPRAIRTVTQMVGRARRLAGEFKSGLDDIVEESELRDLQQKINDGVTGNSMLGAFDDDPAATAYDYDDNDWGVSPAPLRPLDDEDRSPPRRKRAQPQRLKTPRGDERRSSRRKVR